MSMPRVAAFAWLAAGFLAGGSTATAQSFTFERSFPATAASRLEVATNRGKITVRAGTTAELVVTGSGVGTGWMERTQRCRGDGPDHGRRSADRPDQ